MRQELINPGGLAKIKLAKTTRVWEAMVDVIISNQTIIDNDNG